MGDSKKQRFTTRAKAVLDGALGSALYATVLLGIASLIAFGSSGSLHSVPGWSLVLAICALLGVSATWLTIALLRKYKYDRVYYPHRQFDVEILEKTLTYRIDDSGVLHFKRTVRLKARRDGVDAYVDRFIWTGGPSGFPIPGENCAAVHEIEKVGIWTLYNAELEKELKKGQEVHVEVLWPPLENWRKSRPFVSSSTEEPTRSMKFVVQIPDAYLAKKLAWGEVLRGVESTRLLSEADEISYANGRFEWQVPAKLYRHYRIRWAWQGDVLANPPFFKSAEPAGGDDGS